MDSSGISITVVAIPDKDDYVWNISSEKVPHLTLMVLGPVSDLQGVVEYIKHAVATSLTTFGMSVARRAPLGDENADVLFFDKDPDGRINQFRGFLLANETISSAYNSVEQFPEFTPHLTLGYPDTPAKKDLREYPRTTWVRFNRIAVWTDDYKGPEFYLTDENKVFPAVSMSEQTDKFLEHVGIKGMRWGIRRAKKPEIRSTDSAQAKAAKVKLKKHGTKALTNEELRTVINRMTLEASYKRLNETSGSTEKSKTFVKDLLLGVGKQQVSTLATQIAVKQVGNLIKKAL